MPHLARSGARVSEHDVTPRQMAGRAGRAGQSKVGEAFFLPALDSSSTGAGDKRKLRGFGDAVDAAFATVASRLPGRTSQLLEPRSVGQVLGRADTSAAVIGGGGAALPAAAAADADAATVKDVTALATLVLQCVASGMLRTLRDQRELLRSTFAWSVPGHRRRLGAAMEEATRHLYADLVRKSTSTCERKSFNQHHVTNINAFSYLSFIFRMKKQSV